MGTRRHVGSRLGAVALLAIGAGCMTISRERPLPVQAIDAETKQPIRGAGVQVNYAVSPPAWETWGASSGNTGSDGIARLWAAPGDAGITVQAAAIGYLSDRRDVTAASVQAIQPVGLFESVNSRPAAVVVELYAEPRPAVELVLPAGFRGQVRAEVLPREDDPAMPGERTFRFEVPPGGAVAVTGPLILKRVFAPDFRLTFADNTPLSRNAKETDVGYWWLKSDGTTQVFFVGTQGEFDTARRALGLDDAKQQRSTQNGRGGGGQGGGRRGGGRRGGGGQMSPTGP
jgi:hypothetical protein